MSPPTTCTVRRAQPADVPAVAALEQECLGRDAWSEALVREGVLGTLPTVSYLVAVAGGRVVGHAVTSVVDDVAELQRIAVLPAYRRRGVAALLLSHVVAAAAGASRLLLEVREDNEGARALYAAQGFSELARRRRYYADGATAVVMERRLDPGSE